MIVRYTFLAVTLAAWPHLAGAQTSEAKQALKRTLMTSPPRPACATTSSAPVAPSDADRLKARELATRGQQAAILGDSATALSHLRDAAALDPTDPQLAYRLARVYESASASERAVTEYCRFLALAPTAADASEARDRVAALARPTTDPVIDSANAIFQRGIDAYDRGRMVDAEASFARVADAQPTWADVYFDRAAVRLARGDQESAASDLESYLRLKPEADDRGVVVAQIDRLRRPPLSVANALSLGLLIPGGGQFYTHRPGWGLLSLAGAGAAVGYALTTQQTATTQERTATDPFGNPYKYTVTSNASSQPHLIPGVVAAGGIAVISALEAAFFARQVNGTPRRVSVFVLPSLGGLAARVSLR